MKLRKLDKKARSGALAAVIIFAMLIVSAFAGVGVYTGWTFKLTTPPPGTTGGAPKGSYTIQSFAFDSLATTTTRTIATDIIVQYYSQVGGLWNQLGVAVSATVGSIILQGTENGYVYAVVTTSSSYYLDVSKTVSMNNILTYVGYENVIGGTLLPQFVFKINVNGIVPGIRTTADIILNFYAITYAAFTFATAPANTTGVGTALNTTYLSWYMTAPAVSEGIFVRQITLSTNDTSTATQTLFRQNVPNVGFLNGGTFNVNPQASAIVYTWTAPTDSMTGAVDLGTCVPWSYSTGVVNKFDLSTAIQSTLTSGLHDSWTITVYWLTPAGAGASATQLLCIST